MEHHKIVINKSSYEARIALLENNRLAEVYIDRFSSRKLVGNIYRGIVIRVIPGMQAAFVDIGEGRSAFLYAGDIFEKTALLELEDSDAVQAKSLTSIEKLVSEGEALNVQVIKEPLGSKGPRVSTTISFPGRYLVLTPEIASIGISRRIKDDIERDRLKALAERLPRNNMGIILRTAALGVEYSSLLDDFQYVYHKYKVYSEQKCSEMMPKLLFCDDDLVSKTIRDILSPKVSEIIVDDELTYRQIKDLPSSSALDLKCKVTYYSDPLPLFEFFSLEKELERAVARKVWLHSGAYLYIEQTEALTSFDVNTGKFIGHDSLAQNILKVNLEAAQEIARQLRIRNIGGIVVVDFIDMEALEDREKLYQTFCQLAESDRARTRILEINELGLLQMTRKRTAESLGQSLGQRCLQCQGSGWLKSSETVFAEAIREVEKQARLNPAPKSILLTLDQKLLNLANSLGSHCSNSLMSRRGIDLQIELEEQDVSSRLGYRVTVFG